MNNQVRLEITNHQMFEGIHKEIINNNTYWDAEAVARSLKFKQPLRMVRDRCKKRINIKPRHRRKEVPYIPESDLLNLFLMSPDPGAVEIQDWIFGSMIPKIFETGSFTLTKETMPQQTIQPQQQLS